MPFHYRALTAEEETQISGSQEAKIRENVIARTVARLHEHPTIVGMPQLANALMAPKRNAAGEVMVSKDGSAVPLLPHHLNRWAMKHEANRFIHEDHRRCTGHGVGARVSPHGTLTAVARFGNHHLYQPLPLDAALSRKASAPEPTNKRDSLSPPTR